MNDLGADIMNDSEYKRCFDNTYKQFDSLRESLPPEVREKFVQYDESMTEKQCVCEDFHYMAGLRDGCALARWLIIHEAGNGGMDIPQLEAKVGATDLHVVSHPAGADQLGVKSVASRNRQNAGKIKTGGLTKNAKIQ